jgi:hypothetical protein
MCGISYMCDLPAENSTSAGVLANRLDVGDFVDGLASEVRAKSQYWRVFQC